MFSRFTRIAHLAAAVSMVVLSVDVAVADDTEVFQAIAPSDADTRPNVMLIIDTSGSMSGEVETQETWDPAVDFDGECSDSYIYWQGAGDSVPDCDSKRRISVSNFVCQAALPALSSAGQVTVAEAVQWRQSGSKAWVALASDRDRYVECRLDHPTEGTHSGLATDDSLHPRDGNSGPFSNSNEINWSGGKTYTFYTGNRINYMENSGRVTKTRIEIVREVAKATVDSLLDNTINIGLMRFDRASNVAGVSNTEGGYILHEIAPIEDARTAIKTQIDTLTASSWTPLSETLFEAYSYFTGGAVKYGKSATGTSVTTSRMPDNQDLYKSPMANTCQANFIILLTDGEPTKDTSADASIEGLSEFAKRVDPSATKCSANVVGDGDGTGVCLDDLAEYMYKRPDLETPTGRNIKTFTIGFGPEVSGSANLQNLAKAGGGDYYTAADTTGLTTALTSVFNEIFEDNLTFTAPAVSVNAFNRTQNLRDLFFTVFQPNNAFHWPGNLKKYKLGEEGEIVDRDNEPAVDPTTGFFADSARSYWSGTTDGAVVDKGGAAHKLPTPADRKLYTDIAAYLSGDAKKTTLTDATNSVVDTNVLLTAAVLGMPDDSTADDVEDMINWARGADVDNLDSNPDTTQRFEMGDPLHARAATVIYGGTEAAPDIVVFAATNDGYLHAINGTDGSGVELWSFIPSELLPHLYDLRSADPPNSKHYGLDGSIRVYKTDLNGNGKVDGSDQVVLFFGMGRGGSNYYALDVTSKGTPKLLWRRGPTDLPGIGQTWSTPVVGNVTINGTKKLVIIVGGGYDGTQDDAPANTDDIGNGIYMLDALSGSLLWSAGSSSSSANFKHAKMEYSIPADVRAVDMSSDGLLDRMYVGDMGGRVWRFDIDNENNTGAASLVTGGVIASLGAASDSGNTGVTHARRFYGTPDIALLKEGNRIFLNLAIGSGYRGHPLNTQIRDRFYALRDGSPFQPLTQSEYNGYSIITDATVVDVTEDLAPTIAVDARGWKIDLRDPVWQGEKVFSDSRTLNGITLFSSFAPVGDDNSSNQCTAQSGTNRLYCVNASNGSPACDDDRFFTLKQNGIAPAPVIIFPPKKLTPTTPAPCEEGEVCEPRRTCENDGNCPVPCVGAECLDLDLESREGRTFWNTPDTNDPE